MTTPVLIDCDPGHDDAIAILLALASPELEVLGITTVSGNQSLEHTTANTLRVLEFVGRGDVPVAAGADRPLIRDRTAAEDVHGESGLDGPELPPARGAPVAQHAVDFLADRILACPDRVTLIPLGPLTNVALLIARHREAAGKLERIVLMGGAIGVGNVTPAAEFNIWADPEAAQRVFSSGIPVTMIGLDVTHQALMSRAHAEALRASGPTGAMVAELWDFFSRFHTRLYGHEDSPVHDAVAVAQVAFGDLVQTERRHVAVETDSELCRGRTVVDLWQRTGQRSNADVGVGLDAERFFAALLERLPSLDR